MNPEYEAIYAETEERHPWFVARRDLFSALLGDARKLRILDVGCGTGMFLAHLKRLGFEHLAGVEPSDNLRARFRDPSITLHADLPDRTVDRIFMLDVLEHIEHDRAMLERVHATLSPGGLFYLSVPAHPALWSRHDEVNRHCRRYRRREVAAKLTDAGFRVRRLSYWNMFAFPAIWLTRRLGRRRETSDLSRGSRLARRIYGLLLRVENAMVLRFSLPMGVSLIAIAEKPGGGR